ncbi:CMRF35-like molecule 7 [Polypterus senegalus]|uniref:CMRF35-like molecule 7 n=1 Tax=Polypterus senegalus TaxID=55291 RepID=UPI001963368C|nr:CMRF35-like molecule 7 [Polypterus senegalus]
MTDSGHYWCVVEYSEIKLGTPLELRVKASSLLWINDPVVTGIRGGMVSILCHYTQDYKRYVKQWCKGEEWKSCEIVAQSMTWKVGDKVRLDDDESQGIFTVNMRALEMADAGQYWCVMESNGVKLGTAVELIVKKVIPSTETSTSGIPPTVQTSSDMPSLSHKEKAFISVYT